MTELQKKQLEILKQFVRVCEKHNLRYSLEGGTAIGAVRHKGFIPWDDDVDVMMPREDYDKFIQLQYEYDGTPYFIQTWKSDPHYCYNFAKLRDSSTTYIENFFVNHVINHGVWIDIFPIDGICKKNKPMKKTGGRPRRVWFHFYMCYVPALLRKVRKRTFFKDIFFNIIGALFYVFNIAHFHNRVCDRIMRKWTIDNCALSGNMCSLPLKKQAMPSYIYKEYIKVPFEDMEVSLIKDYDIYLSRCYGDYMTPPKEGKRTGHHKEKGVSFTQGYKEYMKEHRI